MKILKLSPLLIPKQLNSNIMIVANYIKSLREDKINVNALFFEGITPDIFKEEFVTFKKRKENINIPLSATIFYVEECQNLIFDTIKETIKEPIYYQIISFINNLAIQLIKFNRNFFLNSFQLLNARGTASFPLRTFIIQSFLKLTKYFTEGAFTNLLNSQKNVQNLLFDQYKENIDINNEVNALTKDGHEKIFLRK